VEETVAYNNITGMIGNTPLVKVNFGTPPTIYAKLEYFNPSGSIKDRSAFHMIETAEARGDIQTGTTIIEASSGNQGIATAMIASLKGYRSIITVSEKVSQEKQKTLASYGAEIVRCKDTSSLYSADSYHAHAKRLVQAYPHSYLLHQYYNFDNIDAHYASTGPEIWEQTEGTVTHVCAGVGSGGTISGAGKYLKEQNPHITMLGVDSPCSYRSTGGHPQAYQLEGLGVDYDTPLLDNTIVDAFLLAPDDAAINMLHWLARTHGIFVGPAGAAVAAMVYEYSRTMRPSDTLVMIFGDSGRAYLSKTYMHAETDTTPAVATSPTYSDQSPYIAS